jgi:hypothetical protein
VAGFLDAAVADVKARWPADAVPVEVDGRRLDILDGDLAALQAPPPVDAVHLLGPFDLFLQGRDRELVVPDVKARKDLWRTLGRPGGILAGAELVGSWRPRASGSKLEVALTMWASGDPPAGIEGAAERLAAFRGVRFDGFQ